MKICTMNMSSFYTLYLKFQKYNWAVFGGYGNLEERSLTFMNQSLFDTTWIMDKIEPEVVDASLSK